MNDGRIAVMARVSGEVQGVGYRAWVHGRAVGLGLRGWVRNEADGSVMALLEGPEAAVEELLAAMSAGPRLAAVEEVTRGTAEGSEVPARFEIRS